jgi:hypothetical protein
LENNIPSSPAELLAMQQGGIREEINHENINALDELIRGEIFPGVNPSMDQVLHLAKKLLQDLEEYHYNTIEEADLTSQQRRVWKRDAKKITESLMALRQVEEG